MVGGVGKGVRRVLRVRYRWDTERSKDNSIICVLCRALLSCCCCCLQASCKRELTVLLDRA
jgi:hypothetical protein